MHSIFDAARAAARNKAIEPGFKAAANR